MVTNMSCELIEKTAKENACGVEVDGYICNLPIGHEGRHHAHAETVCCMEWG